MYRRPKYIKTSISCNDSYEGESIEKKMRRVTENNEPIDNTAPLIYTEKKDGVLPQYDIRTDRWDVALEAMDKIAASLDAKRDNKPAEPKDTGTEPAKTPEPGTGTD